METIHGKNQTIETRRIRTHDLLNTLHNMGRWEGKITRACRVRGWPGTYTTFLCPRSSTMETIHGTKTNHWNKKDSNQRPSNYSPQCGTLGGKDYMSVPGMMMTWTLDDIRLPLLLNYKTINPSGGIRARDHRFILTFSCMVSSSTNMFSGTDFLFTFAMDLMIFSACLNFFFDINQRGDSGKKL